MKYKLISACLLGVACRYDGKGKLHPEFLEEEGWIPICPEQLSGMPTPREPVEIKNGRVLTKNGEDFTAKFHHGADECVKLAKLFHCEEAILKARSPSCGFGQIYDGSFSGHLIPGMGITAQKLHEAGIHIFTEEEFGKGEKHVK